ncbi:MAG: sulfatase [Pseudomonadales bacterium]
MNCVRTLPHAVILCFCTLSLTACVVTENGNTNTGTDSSNAKSQSRPNVVFILTDDQRADAVGYHANPLLGIKTPHIDRLAAEGVRFDNMFVTTSLCSPSRASFLSGTYAHTHGVINNFTDYPAQLQSFPLQLQADGYQTAYIGKWHMGEQDDSKRPGFDYWVTHKGQGKYYDTTFNVNGERKEVAGYYTQRVTDMALDWLNSKRDESAPFALLLGHKAPHGPFVPEEKYQDRYNNVAVPYPDSRYQLDDKPAWIKQRLNTWHGIYGPLYAFRENFPNDSAAAVSDFERFVRSYTGTINSVDDSVGRVYAALEELGELDNTVFVFASDNGFLLGEHGMIDKRTAHEASTRVPLVVRYPARFKAGTIVKGQVLSLDVAPSIVELTGSGRMDSAQGLSWVALAEGKASEWRETWLYEYNYEKQFPYTPNVRSVRTHKWKYIQNPHGDGGPLRHIEQLYNLEDDPGELVNVALRNDHRDVLGRMRGLLERTLKESGALPDQMPIDEGVKAELPEESIR